mmetsp:Transcript_27404/g.91080  ORF Transcript_27404/g.91080 Transcript_27404/m.91080 type:complete len:102 (+) Transcript_27404:113-418(+)
MYWDRLHKLLAFFNEHGYYVFLKWPCTLRQDDGGFQRTAYAPLGDRLLRPQVPEQIASGRDPHDLLILDRHQPELFKLIELGNAECGLQFPAPWSPCRQGG